MSGGWEGEIDGPNPSLVAWLPFNTTGPIITSSPLAARARSSSSGELANTLHPLLINAVSRANSVWREGRWWRLEVRLP